MRGPVLAKVSGFGAIVVVRPIVSWTCVYDLVSKSFQSFQLWS